ncbi:MAG: hypothetical protein IPP63_19435 [Chloracidobacterium sp.]|nr:hypothetical protein [Chloracidobacterium sp.]
MNLAGPLKDSEELATVRSSPALPRRCGFADHDRQPYKCGLGHSNLASTGINTAAEILTDSIINNPARKATDKLFRPKCL